MIFFFRKKEKKSVGVDVGAYSVKIVELTKKGKETFLTNYGEAQIKFFSQEGFLKKSKNAFFISPKKVAKAIDQLIKTCEIKQKDAVFSLPDLATFIISFDVEKKEEEEMRREIVSEARKYIPLPPSEMIIDFMVVGSDRLLKALTFAIPKDTLAQYQQIAKMLNLNVISFEPEVFSLIRGLDFSKREEAVLVLDVGEESTTCNFVQKGVLQETRSVSVASSHFRQALCEKLKISPLAAEELKLKYGMLGEGPEGEKVKEALREVTLKLKNEIQDFTLGKDIDKIVLVGAGSKLLGFKDFLRKEFNVEVDIGNPFATLNYPAQLSNALLEIAPTFCVAVGAAKRGLQI